MGVRMGPLLKGLASFLPGGRRWAERHVVLPPQPATYFYHVWLKHLTLLAAHGLGEPPDVMVEIGPGTGLGTGLAALLSGTSRYHAVDLVRAAEPARDLLHLEEIRALLERRAGLPDSDWLECDPWLDEGRFPSLILSARHLARALRPGRVAAIARALQAPGGEADGLVCRYLVPWRGSDPLPPGTADVVLSHAVMAHVDALGEVYAAAARWLRPGGLTSHQLDFSSMNLTTRWNGCWALPEWVWRAVRGRRPYLINRQPLSAHLAAIGAAGLEPIAVLRRERRDGITRRQLAPRWRGMADEDLSCSDAFIIAAKRRAG